MKDKNNQTLQCLRKPFFITFRYFYLENAVQKLPRVLKKSEENCLPKQSSSDFFMLLVIFVQYFQDENNEKNKKGLRKHTYFVCCLFGQSPAHSLQKKKKKSCNLSTEKRPQMSDEKS